MEARHEEELAALRKKTDKMRSMVSRKDRLGKQRVNDEVEALEAALRARHLEERGADEDNSASKAEPSALEQESPAEPFYGEAKSLSRAQKRRLKKQQEEVEAEKRIQEEKDAAGPGERELEQSEMEQQFLKPNGWKIHPIQPDGNCLYSALAHQLSSRGESRSVEDLREIAADQLETHPNEYEPFLDLDEAAGGLSAYCTRVRKMGTWGGQVELRAISESLRVPIDVLAAGMPPVRMGPSGGDEKPLRLSFHRKYYGLGEHYNSIVEEETH